MDSRKAGSNLQNLKKNIFLTGFMGAGKSSVGKALANLFKVDFYDTDTLISAIMQMGISDVFRDYGEGYFRRQETAVLETLSHKTPGSCVVSTGGGAVLLTGNITAMQKNGIIIYLHVTAQEAYNRIKGEHDRPLLQVEDPGQQLGELMLQRKPFYKQADINIDTSAKTVVQVAEEIITRLEVSTWTVKRKEF